MSSMGELTFFLGLQVKQQPDGIFISQDKYVADILKKFDFWSIRTATTPIDSNKPLVKDEDGIDVDVHVYRSMIGSLMYLTASRPDIMFAVCACARFQVTQKASHLHAVKRIFRYLKHQPKLGLWYPRDSPFDLEAFLDSDYGGAILNKKSTTGGCQFLGRRMISWQCKKQTIVANSTTEAEYVIAANYCGQVLWIQNQMMDYDFNFMNTKIHIDNESTISAFVQGRQIGRLRATNGAELVSAARLVNIDRPTLSTVRLSDFHEIVDFLASSSIHHALTIDATVDSKAVVVTEASIRSSLLFNDADGTACITNEAIFQNLALMGYEGDFNKLTFQKALFSPQWKNEGDQVQPPHDSPLSGGHTSDRAEGVLNLQELYVLCTNLSNRVLTLESIKDAQAAKISALKSRIKKLGKKCKPSISHHRAWLKSVKRLSIKKRFGKKEYVSKHGRKKSKPSGETEEVKITDDTEVIKDKSSGDKGGNVEELVTTARPELSTGRPDIDAARQEHGAAEPKTPPITTSIFDDEDITMAQTLIKMKEEKAKEKGVSIKDVDDSSRPERSILTLKPLPTIHPKDKGKSVLEEPEPADTFQVYTYYIKVQRNLLKILEDKDLK
ncbi:hypothetical protein Tco_0213523 [Tanacetum coccineum]